VLVNNKTGQLVIVEVKPLTDKGIKLSSGNEKTGLPDQMTDAWIAHAPERLEESKSPAAQATFAKLQEYYDEGTKTYNVQKAVIGVNSNDVKLVMLK